ncbi:MAG: hypothetical protein IJ480_11000 [Clostridia bacterium]|nr:hypothetical protein [Clostridia bacterium]
MKKIWLMLGLLLCLTGCGKKEDPGILTGIYAPVFEDCVPDGVVQTSALYPAEEGWRMAVFSSNGNYYRGESGIMLEEKIESTTLLHLDEKGEVTNEIPLTRRGFWGTLPDAMGERGLYYFAYGENKVILTDWEDGLLAEGDTASFAEGIEPDRYNTHVHLQETEEGLVMIAEDAAAWFDAELNLLSTITLPEDTIVTSMWVEDGTVWYLNQTHPHLNDLELCKIENGVVSEKTWTVPAAVAGWNTVDIRPLLGYDDGYLYSWNASVGVFRWKAEHKLKEDEQPEVEVVFSFMDSGVVGSQVANVTMMPEGTIALQLAKGARTAYYLKWGDTSYNGSIGVQMSLYAPAPDRDLSEMTVLTLACRSGNAAMEKAVLDFNRSHTDAYIKIVSYEQYEHPSEWITEGTSRFDLELETGLLKADILVNYTLDPIDLYPLMTGTIRQEDIAGCIRNTYENDGKLTSIAAEYSLYSLVGKTEELEGKTSWTLAEFLDFAEGLEAGEYLIEEVGKDNYQQILFRDTMYASFIRDGQAYFNDPLYLRYLEWIESLPKTGQKLMSDSANLKQAVIAGEYSPEELGWTELEGVEENLYHNGAIKLISHELQGTRTLNIGNIYAVLELCCLFDTTDLTFIGYPTIDASGVQASYSGTVYSIPSTCKDPALAWEFIESVLMQAQPEVPEEVDDIWDLTEYFTTWTPPAEAYLEAMTGVGMYIGYEMNNYVVGRALDLSSRGPGAYAELDEDMLAMIYNMIENGGTKTNMLELDEITEIAAEEESRYLAGAITAEECAEIVQSRVSIWLAEHE